MRQPPPHNLFPQPHPIPLGHSPRRQILRPNQRNHILNVPLRESQIPASPRRFRCITKTPTIPPQVIPNFQLIHASNGLHSNSAVPNQLPSRLQVHRPETMAVRLIPPPVPRNPLLHSGEVEQSRVIPHSLRVTQDQCESIHILSKKLAQQKPLSLKNHPSLFHLRSIPNVLP